MLKLCGITIPELSEQIKLFVAECIDKESGEYKQVINDTAELPIIVDVQRNEAAKMVKLRINLGLVNITNSVAHYAVNGKKHKDNASELNEIKSGIDKSIWTAVNIVFLADTRFGEQIHHLLTDEKINTISSEFYGVSFFYHSDKDSQRFMVSNNAGEPIYALEEAVTPLTDGFVATVDMLKSKAFKILLAVIQQDDFNTEGKIASAHTESSSSQDN